HQGYPAFLGISVVSDQSGSAAGADVQQTLANSAAAAVGITAGDVITAIGTTPITSPSTLTTRLAADRPGQHVSVTWTDLQGQPHVATVTLGAGPAA
ncbi:MAG: PDZ domain-containing protein, partial [Allobranchiibius sp.]